MKIKQVIDFVEDYSKPGFNAMWSFVVNALRPFSAGMGLRVACLSPQQVEIVVPYWLRNQDENQLHEATYLAAIKEGQRLWLQRLLGPKVELHFTSYQIQNFTEIKSDARVRFSFESQDLEILMAEARKLPEVESIFHWSVLDVSEKKCAEVEVKIKIVTPLQLSHKTDKNNQKREH